MAPSLYQWFLENKERLFVLLGVFLVGVLCFEAGFIRGKIKQEAPLIVSLPSAPVESQKEELPTQELSQEKSDQVERISSKIGIINCPYVGSKNSNKYHLATCAVAKRIKLENRICFSTKEEAQARGYLPSCLK